ncbi:hypothetical protein PC119_g7048 [Phytophthora cactorum]|nr:hypothetical protein PC119_g7048 [Phytophthora cactorum]KAG3199775.1 hypothetical protein PC128_g5041 [Phytophthora cactorum]
MQIYRVNADGQKTLQAGLEGERRTDGATTAVAEEK